MKKIHIILILLVFLSIGSGAAQAEDVPVTQEKSALPAHMSDEALASYISGRLNRLLKDEDYNVSQYCDADGCSVVIQ